MPMMALLCMGYTIDTSAQFQPSTHKDDGISLLNPLGKDLCGPCTDSDKLKETDSSYKNINALQMVMEFMETDPESKKLIQEVRYAVCNRKFWHNPWKERLSDVDIEKLLPKFIEMGEPGRFLSLLLINTTKDISYVFNGVGLFETLIKSQPEFDKDKTTAVDIAKALLNLGMSPRYDYTEEERKRWPYVDKFRTYNCNCLGDENHNDKIHSVCQYLKQKKAQKKINENTQKELELTQKAEQSRNAYSIKIHAEKEQEQAKCNEDIQNLINKAQKNQPENPKYKNFNINTYKIKIFSNEQTRLKSMADREKEAQESVTVCEKEKAEKESRKRKIKLSIYKTYNEYLLNKAQNNQSENQIS